ncbi:MAG: FAD-binding oxidoreductase [Tepidisphaeraceae bacterium]
MARRRAAGIEVDYLDRATLKQTYGIDRAAALRSADAAEIDPVCFTQSLLRYSAAHGLRVHGQTPVVKYEPAADGVTLTTAAGQTVSARHVIFCTGYETESFLKQKLVTLETTFAVESEPVADFGPWRDRCLIWESRTPYFYCRTTADDRILIGGEDIEAIDPSVRDALLPAKTEALVAKFGELFPLIPFKVARGWAGVFAESHDGMPYIGRHRAFPNGYFALGYGGNGITFAQIAARLISEDLAGRPSADAALFAFDRVKTDRPLQTSG